MKPTWVSESRNSPATSGYKPIFKLYLQLARDSTGSLDKGAGKQRLTFRQPNKRSCINFLLSLRSFVDDEESLMEIISVHGPVAAAVNALSWQNYLGGIIQYHCDGNFKSVNHAVQIVGYDRTGPVPFYIVRNSWGTNFGDKGYLYVAANGNLCGELNLIMYL